MTSLCSSVGSAIPVEPLSSKTKVTYDKSSGSSENGRLTGGPYPSWSFYSTHASRHAATFLPSSTRQASRTRKRKDKILTVKTRAWQGSSDVVDVVVPKSPSKRDILVIERDSGEEASTSGSSFVRSRRKGSRNLGGDDIDTVAIVKDRGSELVAVGNVSNLGMALPGGKRVVELVAAWDSLVPRLTPSLSKGGQGQLILGALKLAVPALQDAPPADGGQSRANRALAIAATLADLKMDAETVAAGLLHEAVEAGTLRIELVERELGRGVGRLLHDSGRVRAVPKHADAYDDDAAKALRQFTLAFHDVRAIVIELAARLETMRHLECLPRYRRQLVALETMQIYAPMAHAIGISGVMWQLEDAAFRELFPQSYASVATWLRDHWEYSDDLLDKCQEDLTSALNADPRFTELAEGFELTGRTKSLFSTMKKLLRDGRRRHEVYDLLGLRVVVKPKPGGGACEEAHRGAEACFRVREMALQLWTDISERFKDYISKPKKNGYQSLHMCVYPTGDTSALPLELQVRTADMDFLAVAGPAAHGAYKGGLTDPEQVRQLKAIMEAAATVAKSRFKELSSSSLEEDDVEEDADHVFRMFDKNGDGVISKEEFREVMVELGAYGPRDAEELMTLVDINTDGTVTVEEFEDFRKQVRILRNLPGVDRKYRKALKKCIGNSLDGLCESDSDGYEEGEWVPVEELISEDENDQKLSKALENVLVGRVKGLRNEDFRVGITGNTSAESSSPKSYKDWKGLFKQTSEVIGGLVIKEPLEGQAQSRAPVVGNGRTSGSARLVKEGSLDAWAKSGGTSRGSSFEGKGSSRGSENGTSRGSQNGVLTEEKNGTPKGSREKENGIATKPRESENGTSRDSSASRAENGVSKLSSGSVRGPTENGVATSLENGPFRGSASKGVPIRSENGFSRESAANGTPQGSDERTSRGSAAIGAPKGLDNGLSATSGMPKASGIVLLREGPAVEVLEGSTEAGVPLVKPLRGEQGSESEAEEETVFNRTITENLAVVRKHLAKREFEEARAVLRELVRYHSYDGRVWAHLASLERKLHDPLKARSYYAKAVRCFTEQFPPMGGDEGVRARQAWGTLEAECGHTIRAKQLFDASLTAARSGGGLPGGPPSVAAVFGLHAWAKLELKEGHVGRARRLLQEAEDIEPTNAVVLQSRALLEKQVRDWDLTRKYFQKATEAAPEDPYCWQAWALFEGERKNFSEMRRLFSRALEVSPNNLHSLHAWARLESRADFQGGLQRARDLYQKCVAVERKNMFAWQSWALLEEKHGNLEAARKVFRKAVQENPHDVPTLQAFARLERRHGDPAVARSLLQTAVDLDPTNAPAFTEWALLEQQEGNDPLATVLFTEAKHLDRPNKQAERRVREASQQYNEVKWWRRKKVKGSSPKSG